MKSLFFCDHSRSFFILPLFMLLMVSCSSRIGSKQQDENPDPAHNSRLSVDWEGVYTGLTTCENCPGTQTVVYINADNTFRIERKKLEKDNDFVVEVGMFEWDASGNHISASLPSGEILKFQVGENRLFELDADGKRKSASDESFGILEKNQNELFGKKWYLKQLMGKELTSDQMPMGPAYMVFSFFDNRVYGYNSCNQFFGTFEEMDGFGLKFSRIASSLKACNDMSIEDEFNSVLNTVDSYYVSQDSLQLIKGKMAPMAILVAE